MKTGKMDVPGRRCSPFDFVFIVVVLAALQMEQATAQDCAEKFKLFAGHSACATKSPDAEDMTLSNADIQQIVNKHNELRRGVNPPATDMVKMSWDSEAAMIAQKWLDTCPLTNGQLSHDTNQARFIPGRFSLGQNLAYGYATFDQAIQAWYDEVNDYTYGRKKSEHTAVVGHYTQVVWAKSIKLGCGRIRCSGNVIYNCNYGPAGNVGDFTTPYTTGTSGAGCQNNDNGVCDCSGLACENGVNLDPSTCTCNCGSRFNAPECSLRCDVGDNSFCGTGGFIQTNCFTGLAPTVTSACPDMCGICPTAEKGYGVTTPEATTEATTATTKMAATTATTMSTAQSSTNAATTSNNNNAQTTVGSGTTSSNNNNNGDDDGATSTQVCLLLLALAPLLSLTIKSFL